MTKERISDISNEMYEQLPKDSRLPVTYHFPEFLIGNITPAHWHEHVEILCVTRGNLRIYIQGQVISAVPGDIVVINPGETHAIPEREPDSRYACLIPHQALCSKMGLSVKDHPIRNLIQDKRLVSAFHHILHILQEKPQLYEIDVQIRLISLVLDLIREYPKSDSISGRIQETAGEQLVKQTISYIKEHYARPLSTKDVCKYLGFDKSYVCSVFKKITGTTMISYLNMVRCEHARELLQMGKLSVSECASLSGFQNSSYFTKTYKHYTGELPSETSRGNSIA